MKKITQFEELLGGRYAEACYQLEDAVEPELESYWAGQVEAFLDVLDCIKEVWGWTSIRS